MSFLIHKNFELEKLRVFRKIYWENVFAVDDRV